jgi:Putative transposase/Transposase zinc-binding domain
MPNAWSVSRLEVADILRAHADDYCQRHPVSAQQAAVVRHLRSCRTAALGGHVDACAACGYARVSYNSCRDRHCPKCQGHQRANWLDSRLDRLLPVPYFHVVFTLPDTLNPLVLGHAKLLYDLLFRAVSESVLRLAADPRRLGAQVGLTAVLHTWGSNLSLHPHLHCVVTGGGLSPDGQRWLSTRPRFFLPIEVLGRLFRGKFLAGLRELYDAGRLRLEGSVAALADAKVFRRWLTALYRQNWVIYAKRPFGGTKQVFAYLGRYSHRVAISNSRLVALDAGIVTFQWKDYAHGQQIKLLRLTAEEFIRRFLLHVLPRRFVRIRHYGLLAGRNVPTKLARCRALLGQAPPLAAAEQAPQPTWAQRVLQWTGQDPQLCPRCQGPLLRCALGELPIRPALAIPVVTPVLQANTS